MIDDDNDELDQVHDCHHHHKFPQLHVVVAVKALYTASSSKLISYVVVCRIRSLYKRSSLLCTGGIYCMGGHADTHSLSLSLLEKQHRGCKRGP